MVLMVRVLVQTPHLKWWALVPADEARAAWSSEGLHYSGVRPLRVIMGVFGGVFLSLAPFVVLVQFLPLGAVLALAVMMAPVGFIGGTLMGRRAEARRAEEGRFYAFRSVGPGGARTLSPMKYTRLSAMATNEQIREINADGEDVEPASKSRKPGPVARKAIFFPWTAHSVYQVQQMRDWREFLRGGTSVSQKIAVASLLIMAISVLIITFLAFAGGPTKSVGDSTPPPAGGGVTGTGY